MSDELAQLKAALKWVDEVYPAKSADSGGAICVMTWEQWNELRRLLGLRPHTGIGRSSMPYRVIKTRTKSSGPGAYDGG